MSFRQKHSTWNFILFGIQAFLTVVFCYMQCVDLLSSTKGVNITWFTHWFTYSSILLILAIKSCKEHKWSSEPVTLAISYVLWIIGALFCIGFMLRSGQGIWNERDWYNLILASLGVILVASIAKRRKLPVFPHPDPVVKGGFALCFKALPQFVMAINMMIVGGGPRLLVLIIGHLTITIRVSQMLIIAKRNGWVLTRADKGLLFAEGTNEASWILVTAVWLLN